VYKNQVPPPAGLYVMPFFAGEGASGLFVWTLLAKLPYIIVDLAIGIVIYQIVLKITGSGKVASVAILLWLFNPMSTILIDLWSSNDAPMVLFLLSSVYALLLGRKSLSAILYGVAIAVRLIPLAFLPVMLVALLGNKRLQVREASPRLKERIGNLITNLRIPTIIASASIIPNLPLLFVTSLPLLSPPSIQPSSILLSSSYDYFFGITFAGPSVNLNGFRYGIAIILLILYSTIIMKTWNTENRLVLDSLLGVILTLLVLSQWNAQYWLWVMPFVVMRLCYEPKFKNLFLLQLSLLILINITIFSFYYASWRNSFFFFPNYSPIAQGASNFLFDISQSPIFSGLRLDELLISSFASVNILILIRLIWPRISPWFSPASPNTRRPADTP
jgi:hypothetical protein